MPSGIDLTIADFDEVLGSDLSFDDILLLDPDAETVDAAAPHLAGGGVLAIARPDPMTRPVAMDLGRLHYDNIVYVGTTGIDLDAAYQERRCVRRLQARRPAWIAGAGGAMGRMHLQRALESVDPPRLILATEVSAERADDLLRSFASLAETPRRHPGRHRTRRCSPRDFATALEPWPRCRAASTMCKCWPPTRTSWSRRRAIWRPAASSTCSPG